LHGWVQICANGRVGWMGGFAKVDNVFGWMYCLQGGCIGFVTEKVTVMYNLGDGPRGDPMNLAF
jgi:hypothetical protein